MLNHHSIARYARACAARGNLGITWEAPNGCPRTDGTIIYLPSLTSDTTEDKVQELLHFTAHEVSHVLHSDFSVLRDKGGSGGVLGNIWNMLEDHRVDYLAGTMYEGDRLNGDKHHSLILPRAMESIARNPTVPPIMLECYEWESLVRADYYPSLSLLGIVLKNKELLAYSDMLRNIRTIEDPFLGTTATYDLTCLIIKEQMGEEELKKQQEEAESSKEKGEGGGEESGDGEDSSSSDGDAEEGEGKEGEAKVAVIKWSELTMTGEHGKPAKHEVIIEYDELKKDTYLPTPDDKIERWSMSSSSLVASTGREQDSGSTSMTGYNRATKHASGAGLANKLRAKLQIKSRAKTSYAQKKGKLHGASLHRLLVKDAGGYNERIFKDKLTTDILDVSVALLVDTSGSMKHNERYYHAMKATSLMNDVLGNVLKINLLIAGFSTYHSKGRVECLSMAEYRGFNTNNVSSDSLERAMITFGNATLANNSDGEALAYVCDKLAQEKSKRKVLFVLSDGFPESSHERGDIASYTHQVIDDVNKSPIEIYSIGIQSSAVKEFYKHWVVVDDVASLEASLLSLLDKTLLKGV